MLPSVLARESQENTRRFLVTAFEPSDGYFSGIIRRFVETPGALTKGPYLQVGLPFRMGTAGRRFFETFETRNVGFAHQDAAWRRLRSDREPANTLVVTGTGSGKTEAFLYPVLEHCVRSRAAGQRGIKALVIYPMNALANDQARRFAETIHSIPAFAGLRVGLYVGGRGDTHQVMTPSSVITDRDTLRRTPPDVLLTNYKMLDYLLIRPKDRSLWAHNGPETLRYLVVDELHTFDGAQGTDLALLLRRLRSRLGTPAGHLVCVGTSATLGDSSDTTALRAYAAQVFASPFDSGAVITETRDTVAEFLGEEPIEFVLQGRDDFAEVLDPQRYRSPADAVGAWFGVFFAGHPSPEDVTAPDWRASLGRLLKQHLLVHNLLRVLKGTVGEWSALQEQLTGPMPASARPHAARVLDALVALLAWARDPKDPTLPFVTVRVQLWLREMRRLVATVTPSAPVLRSAVDLKATSEVLHLPLVQCIECHTTGWVTLKHGGATRVEPGLEAIYNAWFRSGSDLVRLYPDPGLHLPMRQHLCGGCGHLQPDAHRCGDCGQPDLVPVGVWNQTTQSVRGGVTWNWHDKTCPACGAEERLLLLGARNATLAAQLIEHEWATPYNDDKKLIAFSDSVQDAAHRAGFFGSRTYRNNVRMAISRVIDALATPTVAWTELEAQLPTWLLDPSNPAHLSREAFVTEFIGPNMLWQRAWEKLQHDGALPGTSKLFDRVKKRLSWEAFAELTYLSRRGRTIDRMGLATMTLPPDALDAVVPAVHRRLVEAFGLRTLSEAHVVQWLWGSVLHLRQRGAVTHEEFGDYPLVGTLWRLTQGGNRRDWLPPLGFGTHRPQLLSLGSHRDFEKLTDKGRSWYERWLKHTVGQSALLSPGADAELYGAAFAVLVEAGLLRVYEGSAGRALALESHRLIIDRETVQLGASSGAHELTVSRELAPALIGMPCLDAMHERYSHTEEPDEAEAWMARRYREGDIRRVIAAEHTGLLERDVREALEQRFKAPPAETKPWYENLLSATPTLEMGVDIGSLSSLLLCSVPPSQASFLQRVGRAGRRDGNAMVVTLADGASPHDLYFFEEPLEMMAGQVIPPGTFLQAPEVLRRQLLAFCLDTWVASGVAATAFPDRTKPALDAVEANDQQRFPYTFLDFVRQREDVLLERFVALLDYQPGDEEERRGVRRVVQRLDAYMKGREGVDGLRVGVLNVLQQLVRERQMHVTRANAIKREIDKLLQQPKDEARDAYIDEFRKERTLVLELAKEISDRDLLNTLTDAGLLPNYAFPEAGVELKSLLWRRRHDEDDAGRGLYVTSSQRFERPAASALSEFAPESHFYANQRRVQIDQINMQLASAEEWRLCPSCHHLENLVKVGGDLHAACPRCGNVMWSNIQQKRTLLRFRQAIANTNDETARIDDRSDDREPRFFVRQLLVDFEPTDVVVAWKLQEEHLAFGFEAIRHAEFRDINFGEMGRPGIAFPVADWDVPRPGFKVCKLCGTVQAPPKRRAFGSPPAPAQAHARDCAYWGRDDASAILDCLYLYREFSSEAVRILVPYTRSGMTETVLQSFMAALQLGLQRHYGGRVDHLRITTQEEPLGETGAKRQYVLLYDSVPGGTGYLHQLLSEEAQTLTEVLKKAYDAVRTCVCTSQPDKDGCYRCLYQYRQARARAMVSRRTAETLLAELLGSLDKLERVQALSQIHINPQLDSILEAHFIECLGRLNRVGGLPVVKVTQEIIKGRTGYLLEVGSERYWVRPQVDLGPDEGVAVRVRPDFIIEPVRKLGSRRSVAVFTDGWAYHKAITRDDARKRSALVASGRFWTWSLVWEDVQAALAGRPDAVIDVMAAHARHSASAPIVATVRMQRGRGTGELAEHAVMRLLRWLAEPTDLSGSAADAAAGSRRAEATVLSSRLLVEPRSADDEPAKAALKALATACPDAFGGIPAKAAAAWSKGGRGTTTALLAWPPTYVKGAYDQGGLGAIIFDPDLAGEPDQLKAAWREWLGLFNELQLLPGTLLMTGEGIAHGDYVGLVPASVPADTATDESADHLVWTERIGQALPECAEGMRALAGRGVQPPDSVGVEISDETGKVIAEVEMQWREPRLLALAPHQEDGADSCRAHGWRVVLISDPEWADMVVRSLQKFEGE